MGEDGYAKTRQQGLQQAASMIFALVAVVPLLIFAWTLHAVGAMRNTQALVCLGLALAISYAVFCLKKKKNKTHTTFTLPTTVSWRTATSTLAAAGSPRTTTVCWP